MTDYPYLPYINDWQKLLSAYTHNTHLNSSRKLIDSTQTEQFSYQTAGPLQNPATLPYPTHLAPFSSSLDITPRGSPVNTAPYTALLPTNQSLRKPSQSPSSPVCVKSPLAKSESPHLRAFLRTTTMWFALLHATCREGEEAQILQALRGTKGVVRADIGALKRVEDLLSLDASAAQLLELTFIVESSEPFDALPSYNRLVRDRGLRHERIDAPCCVVQIPGINAANVELIRKAALLASDNVSGFYPRIEAREGVVVGSEDAADVVEAIEKAGFDAKEKLEEMELEVEGMMCQKNCGTTVKNALQGVAGVKQAVVSFPKKSAVVRGKGLVLKELVEAVELVGFDAREKLEEVELNVEGMMCQKNCGTTVKNALQGVAGVKQVVVSFAKKNAVVRGKGLQVQDLIDAVEMVGFDAEEKMDVVQLHVEGMMCQKNCGTTVAKALRNAPGVVSAVVSFANKSAVVKGKALDVSSLISAVDAVGFDAKEKAPSPAHPMSKPTELAVGMKSSATRDEPQEEAQEETNITVKDDDLAEIELQAMLDNSSHGLSNVEVVEVGIKGMSCAACVANVESHVTKAAGVLEVRVALVAEKAKIKFEPSVISPEEIVAQINSLGYTGSLLDPSEGCTLFLVVEEISPAEQDDLLARLLSCAGVTVAEFPDACKLKICYDPHRIGARSIVQFISDAGYVTVLSDANSNQDSEADATQGYWRAFAGSLFFTIPVVLISMVLPHIPGVAELLQHTVVPGLEWEALLLWVLTSVVQFVFGWRFYVNAVNAVRHGAANMDVLVVLGTTSAYAYSLLSLLLGMVEAAKGDALAEQMEEANRDAHFFETSAMLITFILLGKFLESSARAKTAGAITTLMGLQSPTALLCKDPADESLTEIIDLRLVQVGDVLKVVPGARVPVDGEVIKGEPCN